MCFGVSPFVTLNYIADREKVEKITGDDTSLRRWYPSLEETPVQDKIPCGPFRFVCEQAEKAKDWTWQQIGKFAVMVTLLLLVLAGICYLISIPATAIANSAKSSFESHAKTNNILSRN
jgi:hypothetical protein